VQQDHAGGVREGAQPVALGDIFSLVIRCMTRFGAWLVTA
jgi:hypothetical protein